jgi:competence ComEA-like helix-hairpin-helix protein
MTISISKRTGPKLTIAKVAMARFASAKIAMAKLAIATVAMARFASAKVAMAKLTITKVAMAKLAISKLAISKHAISKLAISKLATPRLATPRLARWLASIAAVALLVAAMGGTWSRSAVAAPPAAAVTTPRAAAPGAAAASGAAAAPGAVAAPAGDGEREPPAKKSNHKQLAGKLNLNTANEEQLMMLPAVGPAKAERIVAWRNKNGGFKRVADLRRVKGFGYKTFKKLEPFLDIKGDTTLAPK